MLEPRYPLFPLVESGLEGLGAKAVDMVADLELGGPQEAVIGLGGQQAGDVTGLVEEGLLEQLVEALGFGLLVGGEGDVRHGASVGE